MMDRTVCLCSVQLGASPLWQGTESVRRSVMSPPVGGTRQTVSVP